MMSAGEEESKNAIASRKFGKYNEKYHKVTEFKSRYTADLIFEDLCQQFYMNEMVGK